MTPAWKLRVIDRLAENADKDIEPRNLAELARMLGADKRGIYVTFDLETDKPQTSSSYVDAICEILSIDEPLQEAAAVDELEHEMAKLRSLTIDQQRAWVDIIRAIRVSRSE